MEQDAGAAPDANRPKLRSRARWLGLIGLLAALFAASWLLTLPRPSGSSTPSAQAGSSGGNTLHGRWPKARVVESSGRLADGRAYRPLLYPQVDVSVGTALTADGAQLRLLVRMANGDAHEVMRMVAADTPQIWGLATAGDDLVWMVSPDGTGADPVLYHVNWRQPGPATVLTVDTGQVVFTGSQYDLVIADGQVHWATTMGDRTTQIRSIPVGGGPVTTRTVDGTYALSAWPWLTSTVSAVTGPIELRNLQNGQRIAVPRTPPEVVWCGPVWCRVLTPGPDGRLVKTELMHPDGTARIRVAAGAISSAVTDVALVDRFEVLTTTIPDAGTDNLKLVLYDVKTNRSTPLVAAAATVQGRGPIVWWSTGGDLAVTWYAVDLRTLR